MSVYQQIFVWLKGREEREGCQVESVRRQVERPSGGIVRVGRSWVVRGVEIFMVGSGVGSESDGSDVEFGFGFEVEVGRFGFRITLGFEYPYPCLAIFKTFPTGGMINIPVLILSTTGFFSNVACSASVRRR